MVEKESMFKWSTEHTFSVVNLAITLPLTRKKKTAKKLNITSSALARYEIVRELTNNAQLVQQKQTQMNL